MPGGGLCARNGKGDDSMFFLSDQILDGVKYQEESPAPKPKTSWKDSNIRKWLNSEMFGGNYTSGGFFKTAFNSIEQSAVKATEKKGGETASPGDTPALTGEKVFLLSVEDVNLVRMACSRPVIIQMLAPASVLL